MAPKNSPHEQSAAGSPTEDQEQAEQTGSEEEAHSVDEPAGTSSTIGSSAGKKKMKKKSKMSKVLASLKGKSGIPDELVNRVLDKVKAEGGVPEEDLTTENIREVLNQLKIMDVVQGKAGIGGLNKKDMGEHKVGSGPLRGEWLTQLISACSFGKRSLCHSQVYISPFSITRCF